MKLILLDLMHSYPQDSCKVKILLPQRRALNSQKQFMQLISANIILLQVKEFKKVILMVKHLLRQHGVRLLLI